MLMEYNLVLIMDIIWVLLMSSLMVQFMFKHVVSITDEQLEYHNRTFLDLSDTFKHGNAGVRRSVGRFVGWEN